MQIPDILLRAQPDICAELRKAAIKLAAEIKANPVDSGKAAIREKRAKLAALYRATDNLLAIEQQGRGGQG